MAFDYHSVPLQRPSQEIRLLSLHLDDDDDTGISGDLAAYELEACPPYVGISYTWGDRLPRMTIQVNGIPLKVQHNCWYALWQMRHHGQHATFWMDQVCINQDNIDEKNTQVALMGSIYRSAFMVASCLGSGNTLIALRDFDLREEGIPIDVKEALETLHRNPYFNRMWIKQEVILAKIVRLFCGLAWLDWHRFEEISYLNTPAELRSVESAPHEEPHSAGDVHMNHVRLIEGRRQQQSHPPQPDQQADRRPDVRSAAWERLWQLLTDYGDAQCHDPHDKIYAILPLIPDNLRAKLDLLVDYRLPLLTIALEVIRNMLEHAQRTTVKGCSGPEVLPASRWTTVVTLVSQWFRLNLHEHLVRELVAQRSTPRQLPTLSDRQATKLRSLIATEHYARMIVVERFVIKHRTDQEFRIEADDSDFVHPFSGRSVSLSSTMSASELPVFLCSWVDDIALDEMVFRGRSSLASLPPEMPVKVVIYSRRLMFVVSPETVIGDEVLHCDYTDPSGHTKDAGYMPVVRRYDQEPKSQLPAPARRSIRYSFLIGWALRVDYRGELYHQNWGMVNSSYLETLEDINISFNLGDVEFSFNLHYEDLVLLGMLCQEPKVILTQPCMHPNHPSFLAQSSNKVRLTRTPQKSPTTEGK